MKMKKMKTFEIFVGGGTPTNNDLILESVQRNLNSIKFKVPVKVKKFLDENIFSYGDLDDIINSLENDGFDAYWLKDSFSNWKSNKLFELENIDEPDRDDYEEDEEDDYEADYEKWKEKNQEWEKYDAGDFDDLLDEYINDDFGTWNSFIEEFKINDSINNIPDVREQLEIFHILQKDFNDSDLVKYFEDADKIGISDIKVVGNNFEDGKFTIEVKSTKDLTDEEIENVKDYIEGQCSDGWGEGFEQQEIGENKWCVSTWWYNDMLEEYEIEVEK